VAYINLIHQRSAFPVKDFEDTLKKCEKTLEPYADHLVDRKMTVKKFIFTIRYIGMEKEIDGLRKQISGHYQALNMCISFLQL
jgi:wobble nucleotide-excising tRNase